MLDSGRLAVERGWAGPYYPGVRVSTLFLIAVVLAQPALAGPWIMPGDTALRHDIQVLSDAGVITAAVTTWPLSWGDIAGSLSSQAGDLSADEIAALARLEKLIARNTRTGQLDFKTSFSVAANAREIRTFEDGPRENAEIGIGAEWTGNWLAFNLEGQWVDDPDDGDEWRADGSYVGAALGNWMFSASISDRWWGPAWQGSLIQGNNNRPIPGFTIERNSTEAFKTRWLSWIGPWDATVFWGFLGSDREVPNSRVLSMRINFRPLRSLEIGLSRTAIWCGSGVNCDFDALLDVIFARSGDSDAFTEGDQRAGWDVRWSGKAFSQPFALYGHMIGEDEADYLPSSWFGQFGGETWGYLDALGSYRVYLEWADTECDFRFYQSIRGDNDGTNPNCAYNNVFYRTGYRYEGRSIGHSFDNDASIFTLGGMLIDHSDNSWLATFGIGNLNRRGFPDPANTVAEVKTRYREFEIVHKRAFGFGDVSAGLGYEYRKDTVTDESDDDFRAFVEWRRTW